jgi:AhpD family alkylhydroperoxidase
MAPRFNMFDNEIGAKFAKRFANASLVIAQSPLPMSTQELMALRASQINGCGWCVDLHTKEAAAAGETSVRLNLVAAWREARGRLGVTRSAGRRPPAVRLGRPGGGVRARW